MVFNVERVYGLSNLRPDVCKATIEWERTPEEEQSVNITPEKENVIICMSLLGTTFRCGSSL